MDKILLHGADRIILFVVILSVTTSATLGIVIGKLISLQYFKQKGDQ